MDDAKAAFEGLITAFNQRDYDAYESLITDDIEAYAGVHTPMRFTGKQAWMEFVRGLDRFAAVTQQQRHASYRRYGDVVLNNAYFVFSTESKDGPVEVQSGRQSATLVKTDRGWLIANLHFSALF